MLFLRRGQLPFILPCHGKRKQVAETRFLVKIKKRLKQHLSLCLGDIFHISHIQPLITHQ